MHSPQLDTIWFGYYIPQTCGIARYGLTESAMQKLRIVRNTLQDVADDGERVGGVPALHPFPEGWYFVADRRSITKQRLIQKQWLGQDIIAWCDDEGTICVARSVALTWAPP